MEPGFGLSPVLFVTALAAGLVSFASPCVLPLVPAYLGFITGRPAEELTTTQGRARVTIVTSSLAFVVGWTPCIGPFLGGLLGLAAQQETVGAGVLLLLVYALGLGVPFVIAGLAVNRSLSMMRALKAHMLTIERVSGALVIGMGVLLFTGGLTLITAALTRVFGNGFAL